MSRPSATLHHAAAPVVSPDPEAIACEMGDGIEPDTDGSYKEDSFETSYVEEGRAHA